MPDKIPPNEFSKSPTADQAYPHETLAGPKLEDTAGEDAKADKFTENTMREFFAGQPKRTIKTRQDEWVQVNGYTFLIKGGEKVEVPEGIAEILEEAQRI